MSLIRILNSMDISIDTTSGVYPAVLKENDKPIGFLNENLSVSLLKEVSNELQEKIENAISFEKQNSHLQQVNNEYQISFYDDVVLTADFDVNTGKEKFNIYSLDGAGQFIYVKSIYDRLNATKEFAELSGMNNPEHKMRLPEKIRVENIDRFGSRIINKGYVIDAPSNELSKVDVNDKNGNLIGYIDKNDDLIITTNDEKVRVDLQKQYSIVQNGLIKFPPIMERFRDKLKGVGLNLRGVFKKDDISYNITDKENVKVAEIDNNLSIKFTPYTNAQVKQNIINIANEINSLEHNTIKFAEPTVTQEQERQAKQPQVAHSEPQVKNQNITAPNADKSLDNILLQFNPQEREILNKFINILSQSNLINIPQEKVQELKAHDKLLENQISTFENINDVQDLTQENNTSIPETIPSEKDDVMKEFNEVMDKIGTLDIDKSSLSTAQQRVAEDFEKQITLIKTMVGFNKEEYKDLMDNLKTQYGTVNAKEFVENLKNNKYTTIEGNSLKDRVSNAQKQIDIINNKNTEQQKNVNLEMEI